MTRGTSRATARPTEPASSGDGRALPEAAERDASFDAEPFGDTAGFDDLRDTREPPQAPAGPAARAASAASRTGAIMDARPDDAARIPRAAADGPATPVEPMRRPFSDASRQAEPHEPLGPDDPLTPLPFNPYKGNRGITRAWHALKNSMNGFRVAIREESAFRQELTLTAILVPCGVFVPVDAVSHVLLLGSVMLVLIVELLNSSVEAAIDRISLERHELSKRAKDLGSAAVMVALFVCVMTWVLIVGPLLLHWVGRWIG
jgi:diacylglycerol kinase (ATP)